MANDGTATSTTVWPIPQFRFEVRWDAAVLMFQEVSGLDVEPQPLAYRHGDDPNFSTIKMPGLKKVSDVTLKKGVFKSDNRFWDWYNEVKMNTVKRKPVTIRLLDEAGAPTMVWTLVNAWPSKITGTDPKATGNEVAMESVVISHEGLSVASA